MVRGRQERYTMEASDEDASVEAAKETLSPRGPRKTVHSSRAKKRWTDSGPFLIESGKNPDVSDERYAD